MEFTLFPAQQQQQQPVCYMQQQPSYPSHVQYPSPWFSLDPPQQTQQQQHPLVLVPAGVSPGQCSTDSGYTAGSTPNAFSGGHNAVPADVMVGSVQSQVSSSSPSIREEDFPTFPGAYSVQSVQSSIPEDDNGFFGSPAGPETGSGQPEQPDLLPVEDDLSDIIQEVFNMEQQRGSSVCGRCFHPTGSTGDENYCSNCGEPLEPGGDKEEGGKNREG